MRKHISKRNRQAVGPGVCGIYREGNIHLTCVLYWLSEMGCVQNFFWMYDHEIVQFGFRRKLKKKIDGLMVWLWHEKCLRNVCCVQRGRIFVHTRLYGDSSVLWIVIAHINTLNNFLIYFSYLNGLQLPITTLLIGLLFMAILPKWSHHCIIGLDDNSVALYSLIIKSK